MSSGTAREHVRVARALRDLPVIREEFAAARLSYAKVRALTRIATPDTEAGLAEMAGPMTGNQLERFARAHRQASQADDAAARVRRRLAWRLEEDGSLAGTFRLPPLQGAVLHLGADALTDAPSAVTPGPAGVSAETPVAAPSVPGDPADPGRCHVARNPGARSRTATTPRSLRIRSSRLVRRAARSGPRHLHLPGQRPQLAGAAGTGPGPRPRSRPGLRTRRLARPDTPVLRPAHRRMTARARTPAAQPARQTGGAAPARLRY